MPSRRHGVNRTHVIHARVPGALLLELYSRDGLGTMVSADFYEGAAQLRLAFVVEPDDARPQIAAAAADQVGSNLQLPLESKNSHLRSVGRAPRAA